MNRKRRRGAGLFAVCMAIVILTGCATGANLVKIGRAAIETAVSGDDYIRIHDANIYQDGNELKVSGKVKQIGSYLPRAYNAHVDLAVLSPQGTVVKYGSAGFARTSNIKRHHEAWFSARFPLVAEQGTKIILAYHRLETSNSKTSDCRQNVAVKAIHSSAGLTGTAAKSVHAAE
jgi:hypothetical protein